ncbi:hypothetical protein IFM89_035636 [Coptis chinensis]|uniref:Uncharacterized protein n=1 Tax=Coptis chinensis TaxID=261450 RepID=A0A835HIY7_9MAGN|nr:hypothetical protein IFM89_035636 [Coptis chinensis]
MIGIADQKLWNLGVGLLSKWNAFAFLFIAKYITIKYVLVHLRILNWLVVNSPGAMEQRIIPDLHRGIDGDSQISQNRM